MGYHDDLTMDHDVIRYIHVYPMNIPLLSH